MIISKIFFQHNKSLYKSKIKSAKLPCRNGFAVSVLLCAAVAEEAAVLAVGDVVVPVTHACADGAAAGPVNQPAGVAVVPVLVYKHSKI